MLDEARPILLIDDDQVDIENVRRAFQKYSIKNPLIIANDGIEALQKLQERPLPAIVLLDINMPKMNGIEFLKCIREDEKLKSLLVFVLTSSDEHRDKIATYKFNVAGYIVKPLQFSEFLTVIESLNSYWKILEYPS